MYQFWQSHGDNFAMTLWGRVTWPLFMSRQIDSCKAENMAKRESFQYIMFVIELFQVNMYNIC